MKRLNYIWDKNVFSLQNWFPKCCIAWIWVKFRLTRIFCGVLAEKNKLKIWMASCILRQRNRLRPNIRRDCSFGSTLLNSVHSVCSFWMIFSVGDSSSHSYVIIQKIVCFSINWLILFFLVGKSVSSFPKRMGDTSTGKTLRFFTLESNGKALSMYFAIWQDYYCWKIIFIIVVLIWLRLCTTKKKNQ